MLDDWDLGRVRKWFAGLTTTAMVVLGIAAFFGLTGIVGNNSMMLLIGTGIAGTWWYFESRKAPPGDPEG